MAFRLDNPSMFIKGTADLWAFNPQTGDVDGYTDKLDTTNLTSSANNGEIRAGLGAPVAIYIPDSAAFGGEVTAQDFSLEARQFQTGGTLSYNAPVLVSENIQATGTKLTVTGTPVSAYGEDPNSETYFCLVGKDGVNYQVNPTTKEVVNFTATSGQTYCVTYFIMSASARELSIPTVFRPEVKRLMIRMAVYKKQGTADAQGTFDGYLYIHIPLAQFVDGDAGVNGSQTENATTSWQFQAISYSNAAVNCDVCAQNASVYGYMVYAPCGDQAQAVEALVIVGGGVTVAEEGSQQIPVRYLMPDGSTVQPNYADLTYQSEAQGTATVSPDGVVTGVAEGGTTVTISITSRPEVTAPCPVTVTAA